MKRYIGPALGGPAHGRELSAETPTVYVPVVIKGAAGFGHATYRWAKGAWIFEGQQAGAPIWKS